MSSLHQPQLILGIETSCDETAAAVVSSDKRILSNIVLSQWTEHEAYGGVVPEIAARAHMLHMENVVQTAMREARVEFSDLSAIAATGGPGLIGGVIVGVMTGKAIASVHQKPFLAVNHLEGHALTVRLTHDVPFPYLLLLVSGGHCQFLLVQGVGKYIRLGGTLDDALGEAYDKVAKMLGLGYPGGPAVEMLAKQGNAHAFNLPLPLKGRPGCDFSFSGLKTAVRLEAEKLHGKGMLTEQTKADICASFQRTAAESVMERMQNAIMVARTHAPALNNLVVAGGVAANLYLREMLQEKTKASGLQLICPPPALCTDNAAMIAWAGIEHFQLGARNSLDFEPRARWPLAS